LASQLTSGSVYFDGPHANAANGGSRVRLYAPGTWAPGSSYSHLDDDFNGTVNAMMTYSVDYGESIHDPGLVTMGILHDNGWPNWVTLNVSGSSMAEAGGVATVTANLASAVSLPVTVNLAFSGTATLTSDYTRSGTSITIPAGSLSRSVTLTAVQDALDESDETLVVDISSVVNGTESGTQRVTATIMDDDSTVTFDAQGGVTPSPASKIVTFGATYGALATTTRSGYTFSGWWTGTGGTGTEVTAATTVTITSAQTLYAKWAEVVSITLEAALDTTSLSWTTGGHSVWFGQSATHHDGTDAAQSGLITHNQTNWIQTTVTGPGTLFYWWKVSSEAGYDKLVFSYDGYIQAGAISGTTNEWTQQGWNVPVGTHTLRWSYCKDISDSLGADCGWVDQVSWTPATPVTVTFDAQGGSVSPATGTYYVGSTYGTLPVPMRAGYIFNGWWTQENGAGIQITVSSLVSASYPVLYAKWQSPVTLGLALDNESVLWTTGGDSVWFGQPDTNYDGVDAAQSGAITDSQSSWLQTTVEGPGELRFWWKVGCEDDANNNWDFLCFLIDGEEQRRIDGQTLWLSVTNTLAAGTHILRWEYRKDNIVSEAPDAGWVDQFEWVPASQTTSRGTPYPWLDQYGLVSGGNYEAADLADTDVDGLAAWQEYVAGSTPTNHDSVFLAKIAVTNAVRRVTWTPDLGGARVYTVEGKAFLTNAAWMSPTNAETRFFRVKVQMP
jgi:uncharacterized repeat protein (TIGR02543 family)